MRIKSKKSQREYGLLNSSDLKAAKYYTVLCTL